MIIYPKSDFMKYIPILMVFSFIFWGCNQKTDKFQIDSLNNIIQSKLKENEILLTKIKQFVREEGNKPKDTIIFHKALMYNDSILFGFYVNRLHESNGWVKRGLKERKIENPILLNKLNHFDSLTIWNKDIIDSLFLKTNILEGLNLILLEFLNEVDGGCRMIPSHAFLVYKEKVFTIGDTIRVCIIPGQLFTERIYKSELIKIDLYNTKTGKPQNYSLEFAGNAAFLKFVGKDSGTYLLKGSLRYRPIQTENYFYTNTFYEQIQVN